MNLINVFVVEIGSDFAFDRVGTLGDLRLNSVRFLFPLEAIWSVLSFETQKPLSDSTIFPDLLTKNISKESCDYWAIKKNYLKSISDTCISRFT